MDLLVLFSFNNDLYLKTCVEEKNLEFTSKPV